MSKILIAMSGGVDSSVAASVLIDQGFECIGATLKLFDNTTGESCGAGKIAARMGIPYYIFDRREEFKKKVMQNFVDIYASGRTPNPCIVCNRNFKFGALYDRAKLLGCDYIATGHYARIEEKNGRFLLKKALDPVKDQSYVLYFLTQSMLAHIKFPLGNLTKPQVRQIAADHSFENAHKAESQDICFIPDGNYSAFIQSFSNNFYPDGEVTDTRGNILGRHRGIIHYTIGQRKGLGISAEAPLYVKKINAAENKVVLGRAEEMFDTSCDAENVNWISGIVPDKPVRCRVRIRYHHPEQPATVTPSPENTVNIMFDQPVRAITPGQAAVFYDGDVVLGGGTII